MTKHVTTKRALLLSVLSLLLCVAMLTSTTFAWFTDSVSANGNKIVAGTLDIELWEATYEGWMDEQPSNEVQITDSSEPIFNSELWEPGYLDYTNLTVWNKGTLAAKINAQLVPVGEIGKLAEVIDVYVAYVPLADYYDTYTIREFFNGEFVWAPGTPFEMNMFDNYVEHVGTLKDVMEKGINLATFGGDDAVIEAGENYQVNIALKMPESAGNEYQGQKAGMFDIRILATQATVEEDGFDQNYDQDAEYPTAWTERADTESVIANTNEEEKIVEIFNAAELAGLAQLVNEGNNYAGYTVVLEDDIDLQNALWTPIGNNAANRFYGNLDGNGHTISNLRISAENSRKGLIGCAGGTFSVTDLTIDNAYVSGSGAIGAFVGWCDGAKATFENLTLTGDVKLRGWNGGVGGILGQNPNGSVYASNITVDVNEGSYVSTEGNNYYHDYVGGVFGQIWGASFENITSNMDVICGNSAGAGGISGGATGTWTNISCSGDVTVLKKDTDIKYTNAATNKNEPNAVAWYQTCGTVIGYHGGVTYTNCTSTGTLTYSDGSTSNDMTWIDSEGNIVEDSRFGASRWSTDENVIIND